jgi:alanine racemase
VIPPRTASPASTRPAWSEVDLGAVAANYREVRRRVRPGVRIIASIKANAYGHGAVEVARALAAEGADWLATGSFDEAVAVREAGVETPMLLFAGALSEAMGDAVRAGFVPTVHDLDSARAVSAAARGSASVWIKVDAGLGRLGFPLEEAEAYARRVAELPNVLVEGLYTHLPFVDAAGRRWATERLSSFQALAESLVRAGLPLTFTQALSSAGILAGLEDDSSAVCPGHVLYGLPPASAEIADMSPFRPALRGVKTRLIHVSTHREARSAGIGGEIRLPAGTATGVVAFGRTDGYRAPREGRQAFMLVRGQRVPVRGVSLEHTTLDLTGVEAAVGDEVVVLGEQGDEAITATEIADWQGAHVDDVVLAFDRHTTPFYI